MFEPRPDGLPDLSGRRDYSADERLSARRTAFERAHGRLPRSQAELTRFFRTGVTDRGRDRHADPGRDRHTDPGRDRHTDPGRDRHAAPARDRHVNPERDRHTERARAAQYVQRVYRNYAREHRLARDTASAVHVHQYTEEAFSATGFDPADAESALASPPSVIGQLGDRACCHCEALLWPGEAVRARGRWRGSLCCSNGAVDLPPVQRCADVDDLFEEERSRTDLVQHARA